MSFLSTLTSIFGKVLKGVNTGLAIEQQAAPLLNLIPGGAFVTSIANDIIAVEQLFPSTGLGTSKLALVSVSAAAKAPGIDPTATQAAISQIVAGYNALNAAAAAVKPPAPPTP